ncbi:SIMPL domain-containing protein [Candidatus Roizmanbacteria bacterium]|nr:SIMPL domain-containing protein [Candidatus Roizmanbacteria bacterium]
MYIDFKKIISVLVLLTIGIGIGILGVKLVQYYQTPKQTVSVVGAGEIDAATDQATISIQIKTNSTTYEKAQEENKKDVEKLKSELTKLGIPESRITISSYSPLIMIPSVGNVGIPEGKMMPTYRPDTNSTVTTNLTLILDPIKNIEKVYAVVSKNTNAQIINSYYSLKNRKTWESKAKEEALKDARSQIESVAKINKLKVGKLLTLEDGNNPRPYPITMKVNSQSPNIGGSPIDDQTVSSTQEKNVYYNEQTVKITSSYTATYELY